MKTLKVKISSKGQVVEPEYRQFETIQEVMDLHGEVKILDMINAQEKADCIKEARAMRRITKEVLAQLFATITGAEFADLRQKTEQADEVGDDTIRLNAICDLRKKYNI